MAYQRNVQNWMDVFHGGREPEDLALLLADDAVMLSPVVHTPLQGKTITMAYLLAASAILGNKSFRYVRVFDCDDRAVLEFETTLDGIHVNGVDMIEWNCDGEITEFKVMLRPLKAIQIVHQKMGEVLEQMKSANA